jgi:VIT1/CCC1 family predicted Fe2+/Mn2+ transporter
MSISKRLEEARKAYASGDTEAAARAHESQRIAAAAQEKHGGAGSQYLGNFVYGGLDGIITTFAVVSGVAGAQLDFGVVIILGLANLMGDGFSMATGAFLSAKSDQEYYARERQREAWEVEHFPDSEKEELHQLYLSQGYPEEDAVQMVAIKSRDHTRWVDAMMIEELSMLPDDRKPINEAFSTFAAFLIAGIVPLLIYLAGLLFKFNLPAPTLFYISMALSGVALFALGAAKSLVTGRNALMSGLEMLIVGGLAAGVAYAVGAGLRLLGVG